MTSDLRVVPWGGTPTELVAAAELYARVFAEPPYQEDPARSFEDALERVPRYARTRADFRMRLAWRGNKIIGLAFGSDEGPGDVWRDLVASRVPRKVTEEWLQDRCFFVAELAVDPTERGSGVGQALMASMIADLEYETAVLSCWSSAATARRFYERTGWTDVAGFRVGEATDLRLLARRLR